MRTILTLGAVLAALLVAAPAAAAQASGPGSQACIEAEADVRIAIAARDLAKVPSDQEQDVTEAQAALVELEATVTAAIAADNAANLPVDSAATVAAKAALAVGEGLFERERDELAKLQANLAEKQKALDDAEKVRDKACTPVTTTPPTPEPTPITGDLDCADFPLSDGRTAYDVWSVDKSDPHGLDSNRNGTPCEVVDYSTGNDATVPLGGVATGGGPA